MVSLQHACDSRFGQQSECSGMKFHDLGEVRQKICEAVVAGIGMIFVLHAILLQCVVQCCCSFFEAVVVILPAVEIDSEFPQA